MDGRSTEELPADLQAQVETLAGRLGCERGHWTLEFELQDGHLAKTFMRRGPIRNEELRELGRSQR